MPTVSSRSARFQQLAQTVQAGVAAQAAANAQKLQPSSTKTAKPVDSFGGNLNAASLGMTLDASAKDAAVAFLVYRKRVTKNFGNAGEIDVALGHAQKAQTLRIAELPDDKITAKVLQTITAADFSIPAPISKDAFWKQLDQMSGWDEVKALLKEKAAAIEGAVKRGKAPTDAVEPYWIVDGPPGTGKSTLARLLASFGAAYV